MAWSELASLRNRCSRTYRNGGLRRWSGKIATLHRESTLDSGVFDTAIDATPVRIDNAQLDGWVVTQNNWHYALGQPKTGALSGLDGVVGVGGRQGEHWLRFRLTRLGYLHWPARAWQDVGGAPNYARVNLSSQVHSLKIGPNADTVNVSSVADWGKVWTTPGGGEASVQWQVVGDELKEIVTINQAAREWVGVNRPPTTPLAETWFGLVFRLDWSDIPAVYRAGVQQSLEDDFADDEAAIEMQSAAGRRLAAFMPVDYLYAGPQTSPRDPPERQALRKRFWKDGDGNHYLLVGLRCDTLAGMKAGPLAFDPTLGTLTVPGSTSDAFEIPSVAPNVTGVNQQIGDNAGSITTWWRWTGVALAKDTNTTAAILTVTSADTYDGPAMTVNVHCEAADNSAVAAETDGNIDGRTKTTAFTNFDINNMSSGTEYTVDITGAVDEVLARAGWASGNALAAIAVDSTCPANEYQILHSWDEASHAYAATLDITYADASVIAYDNFSATTAGTTTLTWNHVPNGTPKGALVFVVQNVGLTNEITTVTYGGALMSAVSGSPLSYNASEDATVYGYFLGTGLSANTQAVVILCNATGSTKLPGCYTVTAPGDTEVQDTDVTVATVAASPTYALVAGGYNIFCAQGWFSGQNAPTSVLPTTAAASTWADDYKLDFGSQSGGFFHYNLIDDANAVGGVGQASEDIAIIGVAIRSSTTAAATTAGVVRLYRALLGVGI